MGKLLRLCALALLLALPPTTASAEYWPQTHEIRCDDHLPNCRLLQMVMMGCFDGFDPGDALEGRVLSAAYPQLCGITDGDIAHFAGEFGEAEPDVRENWYIALANGLWAGILSEAVPEDGMDPARRVLLLFLDPSGEPDAEAQMVLIRDAMTDATLERLADAVDAPVPFVRWLVEDDDWQGRAHRAV